MVDGTILVMCVSQDVTQESKSAKDKEVWKGWLSKYTERLRVELEGAEDVEKANCERRNLMNNNNPM